MKSKIEIGLGEADNLLKKGGMMLVNNIGKTVAAITAFVAVLITFTDVRFTDFKTESFASTALMLTLAAYLMYFSLEDAGEKLFEESEEYKKTVSLYENERVRIKGEDIESLRKFCLEYSKSELEYRKKSYIISHALSPGEFSRYLAGEKFDKKTEAVFKRCLRMKASELTPKILLSKELGSRKSELRNPEKYKLLRLIARLIPTTVCMSVTVSVILTAKEGLTAGTVIEGILKLSTLPIVGLRGYANGYSYVKRTYIPWIETKKRLLEAYNEKKNAALDFERGI